MLNRPVQRPEKRAVLEIRAEHTLDKMTLDLYGISDSFDLHDFLKKNLGFPKHYGHNWDAFWDMINGGERMPDAMVFLGWEDFEKRLPHDAQQLSKCLLDYHRENRDFQFKKCARYED